MNFKSLPQLLDHFKEEDTCIKYYEQLRWNGTPICPHCGSDKTPYKTNRGYKCSNKDCHKKYTVKVGTIFQNSKIPLRTWFAAIYLCTAHKKGISSVQLSIDLGITQKTAWFVLHRIREMLKENDPKILGDNTVEVDEAYVGGKEGNKHYKKRRSNENPDFTNEGKPYKEKKIVTGLIERNGRVVLKHVARADKDNILPLIKKHVKKGATIHSDENRVYHTLGKRYTHCSVNHLAGQYAAGEVHTNTIENFWSLLKRGLHGIYHSVSEKHLDRYLNEYASRFNTRTMKEDERFVKFLKESDRVLSYKSLING